MGVGRFAACLLVVLSACSLDRDAAPEPDLRDASLIGGPGGSSDLPTAGFGSATAGTLSSGSSGSGGAGSSGAGNGAGSGALELDGSLASLDGGPEFGTDGGPMGYTPGSVGAPCKNDRDCTTANTSSTCITEELVGGLLSLPGGTCGSLCDLAPGGLSCEAGSTCITIPTFPPVFICMRQCMTDADCRAAEGYKCKKPFANNENVCALPQQP
jgi:hypothetical protein